MKVADITLEELRHLIREVMDEAIRELFIDPDAGLALREEIKERLAASLAEKDRIPLDEVKKRLGLGEL